MAVESDLRYTARRPARPGELLNHHRTAVTVVLITLIAAALRFATLDLQSAWLDEALTIRLVDNSFGAMLSNLASTDSSPPLYYVLVWAWTHVFGDGVVGFRVLSAVAGVATVPLLYLAGRRFSPAAGLWAAALGAVSDEMFHYSQEARAYALFVLLSVAALVVWQRALDRPSARTLAVWSAVSILALLTNEFAVFMFVGQAAVLARRHGWRRLGWPAMAFVVAGAALVPLVLGQPSVSAWLIQTSLIGRLAQAAKDFLIGPYGPWGLALGPAAALLTALALTRAARGYEPRRRRELLELAVVGATAVALPALLAITGVKDAFEARYLLGSWPPLVVLVAAGLAAPSRRRVGIGLGIALIAISVVVIVGTLAIPAYQRDDWRGAARSLPPASGGRILVSERYGAAPLGVYLPKLRRLPHRRHTVSAHELDLVFLRRAHSGPWAPGEDSLSAPMPPRSPAVSVPAPFRLATVRRTATYATYRFLAPSATSVTVNQLRSTFGDRNADIATQG